MFFQWIMCSGIWVIGLITVGFEDTRQVYPSESPFAPSAKQLSSWLSFFFCFLFFFCFPAAMLGGMMWCIGNVMCIQVIKMIGLSIGLMIWGTISSVTGA
jgi:hypothetical protein